MFALSCSSILVQPFVRFRKSSKNVFYEIYPFEFSSLTGHSSIFSLTATPINPVGPRQDPFFHLIGLRPNTTPFHKPMRTRGRGIVIVCKVKFRRSLSVPGISMILILFFYWYSMDHMYGLGGEVELNYVMIRILLEFAVRV